jgi:hypothetical protein
MACAAVARGDAGRVLRLAGAASRLRETFKVGLSPTEHDALDRDLTPARQALGTGAHRAFAEGRTMTAEQAVRYALESGGGLTE